ncbi:hypothetical protein D3C87_86090 [compost metagenome]
MEELIKNFKAMFRADFKKNPTFENVETKFSGSIDEVIQKQAKNIGINEDLIYFLWYTNGFEASWDYDLDQNLLGRMKILKIEDILADTWEEYFCGATPDEKLRSFKPIDFFTEEACVGLVLDGSGEQTMYYHDLGDNELFSLDIDFKSYFELAIDAKMMFGWQRYLVHLINPRNYTIDFPEKMEKLFPDFELEAFTAKFESRRLSKK